MRSPRPAPPGDADNPSFGTSGATQHWLGTTVSVTAAAPTRAAEADVAVSGTGWLLQHGWEYGFIPALAESSRGLALGYEPGALRWVGRDLAQRLRSIPLDGQYSATVRMQLELAQREVN